jgi:hypothetical protein
MRGTKASRTIRPAELEEIDGVQVALYTFIYYGLFEVGTNKLKAVSSFSPPGWLSKAETFRSYYPALGGAGRQHRGRNEKQCSSRA